MKDNGEIRRSLEVVSSVLLRCLILGMGLMLLWVVVFFAGRGMAYGIHSRLFGITEHEFEMINYCGMAFVKMIVFVAFVVPYVATVWVLKGMARD